MVQFIVHNNDLTFNKSSVKPPGGLFISNNFEFFFKIETGGLFDLAKTMVSVLHKNYNKKPF